MQKHLTYTPFMNVGNSFIEDLFLKVKVRHFPLNVKNKTLGSKYTLNHFESHLVFEEILICIILSDPFRQSGKILKEGKVQKL